MKSLEESFSKKNITYLLLMISTLIMFFLYDNYSLKNKTGHYILIENKTEIQKNIITSERERSTLILNDTFVLFSVNKFYREKSNNYSNTYRKDFGVSNIRPPFKLIKSKNNPNFLIVKDSDSLYFEILKDDGF